MPKKVDIKEGGSAKPMSSVSRILTDLQNGGLIAWVPEDERLIRTKHISENGTYVAAQEALYGYSKLTVNVAGGSDGETVPTLEPDGEMQPTEEAKATEPDDFDEEYGVLEEDPNGTKETIKAPTGGTNKDKSNGSTIVGKDPETGKTTVVTVDKDTGKITKKLAPQAIAITKMPSRMSYQQGDTIDYSGIEVTLYSKYEETEGPDGSMQVDAIPYKDDRYPDGKIPFEELSFPIKVMDRQQMNTLTIGNTAAEVYSKGEVQCVWMSGDKPDRVWTKKNNGIALGFMATHYDGNWVGPVLISPIRNNVICMMNEEADPWSDEAFDLSVLEATYDGIKWYVMSQYHWVQSTVDYSHWVTSLPWFDCNGTRGWGNIIEMALTNFRCTWSKGDGVPVEWKSPYDGHVFTRTLSFAT